MSTSPATPPPGPAAADASSDAQPRHTALDDAQGVFCGALMATLGLLTLQSAGLVTGQIAGLSLVVAYALEMSPGPIFFALNLPFYAFAVRRMGWAFTLKSLAAVGLLSVFVWLAPDLFQIGPVNPLVAAVVAGVASAVGLLALFRHSASLGGVGVVAVYLQDKTGFRAGWTQMIVDIAVFALALFVLDLAAIAVSILGAAVLNVVIALNHRRDRYVAL